MIRLISNLIAIVWFLGVFIWMILILIFSQLMIVFSEIIPMALSGFAHTNNVGFAITSFAGFIMAITGWVPVFRKCYYKLPWLYPFCVMLLVNGLIVALAELIMVEGLSVTSTFRHIVVVIIMFTQVLGCRYLMSLYFSKSNKILESYN